MRCLLGFHDYDSFGRCSRCWHYRGETLIGNLVGVDYDAAYYGRITKAGRTFQSELAAMGENVSLELCADAVRSGFAEDIRSLVTSRAESGKETREP